MGWLLVHRLWRVSGELRARGRGGKGEWLVVREHWGKGERFLREARGQLAQRKIERGRRKEARGLLGRKLWRIGR